jgi:hypothetical protein
LLQMLGSMDTVCCRYLAAAAAGQLSTGLSPVFVLDVMNVCTCGAMVTFVIIGQRDGVMIYVGVSPVVTEQGMQWCCALGTC